MEAGLALEKKLRALYPHPQAAGIEIGPHVSIGNLKVHTEQHTFFNKATPTKLIDQAVF